MKAVILAGGQASRLAPLSLTRPKALLPLLDGTVLSRCLDQLARAGVREALLALGPQAEQIEAWCAQNTPPGMSLLCRREQTPLGTAGALRPLLDELGQDDFLVIPGDVVFSFPLEELIACHRAASCALTLALTRWEGEPAFGMVVTDQHGRVQRFVEKPAWDQVLSSTVSTGIAIFTQRAARMIPPQAHWDIARNLFPLLLEQGLTMGSYVAEGYWQDVGTPEGYLNCVAHLLSATLPDEPSAPKLAPGVWSKSPIPPSVQVVPPCWLDENVSLGEGALIGPHTALGRGSSVGRRALVQRSILLDGAQVADRATLYGAILGPGAAAGRDCVLNEGAILADRASVGEGAILAESVAVWPGLQVPPGARLTTSLSSQRQTCPIRFGDGGVLRGTVGHQLTPELFSALGVILGAQGKAALGWSGGEGAAMLARALGSGLCAGGAQVLAHDGCCPAAASWLGEYYALPASFFVQQMGERAFLHWFDSRGLPPASQRIARLERALATHRAAPVPAGRVGQWEHLGEINSAYAADAARRIPNACRAAPVPLAVPGTTDWDLALANLLERLGCQVLQRPCPGLPAFSAAHGGFHLQAHLEDGNTATSGQLLALIALLELERGMTIAVAPGAPAVIDQLGAARGRPVLRLGRDHDAQTTYLRTPWLRDALFAAGYLAAAMGKANASLAQLLARLPPFALRSAEIPLRGGRGQLMEAFTSQFRRSEPAGAGVRLRAGAGWVTISPLIRRPAVRLQTEGPSAEIAEELCVFYEQEIRRLDQHPDLP